MCGVSDTCHPTCLQEVTLWSKKLQCAHKGTETTERVALASRGMSREEGPGPHSFIEERRTPEADEAGHTLSQKSEQGRQARQEPPRGAARGRAAAYTPRYHGEGTAEQLSGTVLSFLLCPLIDGTLDNETQKRPTFPRSSTWSALSMLLNPAPLLPKPSEGQWEERATSGQSEHRQCCGPCQGCPAAGDKAGHGTRQPPAHVKATAHHGAH